MTLQLTVRGGNRTVSLKCYSSSYSKSSGSSERSAA
ncbi:hypothetical protein Nmel_014653, partial [Mimus melanotis]